MSHVPIVAATGQPYDFEAWCEASMQPGVITSTRIDVLYNGELRQEGLRVDGKANGTVVRDRTSDKVGRVQGLRIVEPTQLPTSPGSVLSPSGYEVQVWRGLVIDGVGPVRCSLGVFGIETANIDHRGVTTISGWDRSQRVSDDKIRTPISWASGATISQLIADLQFRALPWVGEQVLYTLLGGAKVIQAVVHERGADPWDITNKVAIAIGYEGFYDGVGWFWWRPVPNLSTAIPVCDLWETTRAAGQGVLLEVSQEVSRSEAFNQWTVIADSPDDSAELVGVAQDDDPFSLTYWRADGSGFGHKPAPVWRSRYAKTQLDVDAAAYALKANAVGLVHNADFTIFPNYALAEGDATTLRRRRAGLNEVPMLIDSVTYPLSASARMTGRTRLRQELL